MAEDGLEWTRVKAKQHLVNETVLGLREILQSGHCKAQPLQRWEDAQWFSTWRKDYPVQNEHTLCWLAIIRVDDKTVKGLGSNKFKWRRMDDTQVEALDAEKAGTHTTIFEEIDCLLSLFPKEIGKEPSPPKLKKHRTGAGEEGGAKPPNSSQARAMSKGLNGVTLVSYNVRSLGQGLDGAKKRRYKRYAHSLRAKIILLQEHHSVLRITV